MKLYQTSKGTYCEKAEDFYNQQVAECGGRKSDYDHSGAIVEFPFAASPKADFVAWMNARDNSGISYPPQAPELLDGPVAAPPPPCVSTAPSPAKDDLAFRREVEERWDDTPLTWRMDMGMLAFEDARKAVP